MIECPLCKNEEVVVKTVICKYEKRGAVSVAKHVRASAESLIPMRRQK